MGRKEGRVTNITRAHKVLPQIQRLYDRGIKSVIPLFGGKNPAFPGWQKVTDEEAQEMIWDWQESGHAGEETNYGIRLGPGFGSICDIDLDSRESRALARYYLPETAMFGRGGVVTHYLYKLKGQADSRRFMWDKREEKSVLLEFRYSGQTMGPGSIHPETGEAIEWMSPGQVLEISAEELSSRAGYLAAASLLLRDWNGGSRDELALCLVGSMLRSDWDDDAIDGFLRGILIESGDEEGEKRLKSSRLRRELEDGGRVPGLKRLRELCLSGTGLGREGFESLVEWLGLGAGDIVEQLNGEFAVVNNGGAVLILHEQADGDIAFKTRADFALLMANRRVMMGGREVGADKLWLQHRERREYPRGVVFRPGQVERAGEYNLWRGFAVEETEGSWGCGWELYLEHLRSEVCGGDAEVFKWLLGWMAHRVQRPWEVPESAVVLIGERGDGKSSVFKILGRLFGRHYLTVTNSRHLVGNFNGHLKDKVLVLADEAVWGGDKTNEGVLKVLITEDKRVIEMKGKDSYEVDNCIGLGICSNNDWVVPVGRYERRFLVVRTGSRRRGDFEFWDALHDQMSEAGGGLGRMLWDLRRYSLEGWRGNRPPGTAELRAQQERGQEHWVSFLQWWFDREVDGSGGVSVWVDDLYDAYCRWMSQQGYHLENERVFCGCVERMMAKRFKKTRVSRVMREVVGTGGRIVGRERKLRNRYEFWDCAAALSEFIG